MKARTLAPFIAVCSGLVLQLLAGCGSATGRVYTERRETARQAVEEAVPSDADVELRTAVVDTDQGWVVTIHLRSDVVCVDRELVTETVRTFDERVVPVAGPVAIVGGALATGGFLGMGLTAGSSGSLGAFLTSQFIAGFGLSVLLGAGIASLDGIDRETGREVETHERRIRSGCRSSAPEEPFHLDLALGALVASREVGPGTSTFPLADLFECARVVAANLPPDARLAVRLRLPRELPTTVSVTAVDDVSAFVTACRSAGAPPPLSATEPVLH